MHRIRQLHMLTGILVLVVFIATGQYMDLALDHLDGMPDGPRLMYRSAHIYLFFAGALNLVLGCYVQLYPGRRPRLMQTAGSVLILVAPFLLMLSFFRDAHSAELERPVAAIGIYLAALGIALHCASGFIGKR